jgi:hypothetical protein
MSPVFPSFSVKSLVEPDGLNYIPIARNINQCCGDVTMAYRVRKSKEPESQPERNPRVGTLELQLKVAIAVIALATAFVKLLESFAVFSRQ